MFSLYYEKPSLFYHNSHLSYARRIKDEYDFIKERLKKIVKYKGTTTHELVFDYLGKKTIEWS